MSTYINGQLKSENNYVSFNSIHPGVVKTELYTHVGWVKVRKLDFRSGG